MTKLEALEAMKEGKKVSHIYFTSDEYLYIDKEGIMRDESGCNWSHYSNDYNPWNDRSGGNWEKDWYIYE